MSRRISHGLFALALVGVVAGCASPAPSETPAPSIGETPAASVEPSEPAPESEPARTCADYDVPETAYSETESAIASAAAQAQLPGGAELNPGIQFIPSVEEAGMLEAVARICSEPLTETELLAVGNEIAKAIYADPASESISLLMVSPWVPAGDFLDQDPNLDPISTEYQLYLWDAERSLDSNWD